jgi:cyclophilin family peptidyl-prolyl cis-trans isomerase
MRASATALLQRESVDLKTLNEIAELAYRTFQENKFAEAGALAEGVLEKLPNEVAEPEAQQALQVVHARALNVAGVSAFAVQDFEKSARLLNTAAEKNLLIDTLGEQYLDSAAKYIDYWKEEQSIRKAEAAAPSTDRLPRVQIDTSRGKIVVELFENEAPNTVANFISLVEKGFYDGTRFHRVIPGFMAQGGDPNSKPGADGTPGTGGPGYVIACEWDQENSRRHFAGTLSMAHAGRDTGGSQFFLTHLPTPHLDKDLAVPAGRDAHTVFGRVVEGMDVLLSLKVGDQIESAKVISKRNHEYVPETMPEPQPQADDQSNDALNKQE